MQKIKRQKGFSLPSVIIGSIIAAILGAMAISNMWSSVDKSKVVTLSSIIKEQLVLFQSQPNYDYDALNSNGDFNYMPELIDAGLLSPIPDVFEDKSSLDWEIRKVSDNGKDIYYTYIDSTNPEDYELIKKAVESLNISSNRVVIN